MYEFRDEKPLILNFCFLPSSPPGQITLTGSVQQYEGDTLNLMVFAQDRNGGATFNQAGANVSVRRVHMHAAHHSSNTLSSSLRDPMSIVMLVNSLSLFSVMQGGIPYCTVCHRISTINLLFANEAHSQICFVNICVHVYTYVYGGYTLCALSY